jgi:Fic family protein
MNYQKPPYQITSEILGLIQSIAQKLGEINTLKLSKPPILLRKENRIKSIYSSLAIEGNTLNLNQITSILDNKRVLGPKQDIIEVQNAIKVYDSLNTFKPGQKVSLLKAHKLLMNGLIQSPGKFRKGEVGIVKGSKLAHLAPPAALVPSQVKNLLKYVKDKTELTLIKSCVFHYEFEFIHPFEDGNGRMGRLWQTLILIQEFPVFEFIPIEQMIKDHQKEYYNVLSLADKEGQSTIFIEYMLARISDGLIDLLNITNIKDTFETRIQIAKEHFLKKRFSRIDYMKIHKLISPATASRDLRKAVGLKLLNKKGDKRLTRYKFK